MKFCPECGAKFIATAKFCADCGYQRDNKAPEEVGLDWQSFVASYKPTQNQFAAENEAFDGMFFPFWGPVGDWISFEDSTYVWSVFAGNGNLEPLECRSGSWSGPKVVGYFRCQVPLSGDIDKKFKLPKTFVNLQRFVLTIDAVSGKYRPCFYKLKGDDSRELVKQKIDNSGLVDPLNRQLAAQSKYSRIANQVMGFLEDPADLEQLAEFVDPRYLLIRTEENLYVTEDWLNEFQGIDEWEDYSRDEFDTLLLVNSPSDYYSELIGACQYCVGLGDEVVDFHEHDDGYLGGRTFASFADRGKLQYFKANLEIDLATHDEEVFRSKVLVKLHEFALEPDRKVFFERTEDQMANEVFQFAYRPHEYAYSLLVKSCPNCFERNPEKAQVCFNCCSPFVKKVKGKLFACVINDIDTGQLESMSATQFSQWANVFYYVADRHEDLGAVAIKV